MGDYSKMDVVEWLLGVEKAARDLYEEASHCFSQDEAFSGFLSDLSRDEGQHYLLIRKGREIIRSYEGEFPFGIEVAEDTLNRVDRPMKSCREKLQNGCGLQKAEMIQCIIDTEFSEWNEIFLYAINVFKERSRTFQETAAVIQAHEKRIGDFIDSLPSEILPKRHVRDLPEIWQIKYLVVEDDSALRDLFEAFLSRKAAVVTAENGQEALEKLETSFFDIVISDIDMPVMDGVDFFKHARERYSNFNRRFIFCSGNVTGEISEVCKLNELLVLQKPVVLSSLQTAAEGLMMAAGAETVTGRE
jgi:CheY-like chemotaxis protein